RPANIVHQTMNSSSASAASASRNSKVMRSVRAALAAIVATLAGCAAEPPATTAPPPTPTPTPTPSSAVPVAPPAQPSERSRWVAVDWSALPGWDADRTRDAWVALQRGCDRPAPGWAALCAEAVAAPPADDAGARRWLMQRL